MVLEQGALSSNYNAQNPFKTGTSRGEAFNSEVLQKLTPLIEFMEKIGQTHGEDLAQIAMNWDIAKETVPIIGVTKTKYIEKAFSAA